MSVIIRRVVWASSVLTLVAVAAGACRTSAPDQHQTVVDSALPIDTLLSRFRNGLHQPPVFGAGAESRDALIARFVRAVEQADSAAFRGMVLTRAEFAWLYYPVLPEAAPPYELAPGLMWFMIETSSGRGLRTLLEERGGRSLGFVDYSCEGERHHGPVAIWGPCVIRRLQAPGDTVTETLFGPIVGRDGRFKFVSLANKL